MIFISRLLKNLLRKTFGKSIYAYLGQICRALSSFYIKDMILFRYYYIRSRFSKKIIKTKQQSFFIFGKHNRVSTNACNDNTSRTKPNMLMLAEKWNGHNPELGPSTMDWIFFGSLEVSGLATFNRLNHDEYPNQYSFDKKVLNICLKKKPNLIFITSWLLSPLRFKTMKIIKEQLRIPIVVVWGDSVNHMEEAESLLPYIKFNIPLESPSYYLQVTNQPEKYLPVTFTPLDPRIFCNPNMKRDIDVSFVGTMKDHPDRYAGISALNSNGIEVFQSGGLEENRLSIDEYALVYKRSKIALNFCYHPSGMVQIKGHVFEATSCGAMLMEADNPETAKLFEPMVDYVPFTDERDLVDKVRYYLAHDDEREEITANGHKKVNEKYNPEIFWQIVIEKVLQ